MKKNNAAILLFSRTASAEAVAKPLAFGKRSAESVASVLVNRSKKLAYKTGLPVFFFSEKQQRGATFGERFANAFEDVYALGFDNVVAMGNDCLTVSTADILAAADALQTTPSVLGATNDGGAYLIGLQKGVFQKEDFQNIHWQTAVVFDELMAFTAENSEKTIFLSQKSDIDRVSDWKKTLAVIPLSFKKILSQLLFFLNPLPSPKWTSSINEAFLQSVLALRAPPAL